ncbi:MAG TPA: LPS export ABC transporter periplasmic protein LptC [Gammaproteobacteria bacterium]
MSRSTLILIMVIALLAALSSWLSREQEEAEPVAERPQRHIPDYYIAGFNAAAYSADGIPRHRLSADRMTHFTDDGTTQLVHPQLAFIDERGETWQLDAGRGEVDSKGETLLLSDSVNIRRVGEAANTIEFKTGELTVHPTQQFATTHTPVTITAPGSQIEAAGLDAYFAEERLVLHSARGHYAP